MSPVYLSHSLVVSRVEKSHVSGLLVTSLPYTLQENEVSKRRHVTSLPYTLQENEVSKPETCDFSTLFTTRE
jgi:hypothetical protein